MSFPLIKNYRQIHYVEKHPKTLISGFKRLFSTLKRLEVFPIDVWVRRVINELYIKNENEEKVNKKEIEQLAKQKYGNLAGIAQQYLFYWKREA